MAPDPEQIAAEAGAAPDSAVDDVDPAAPAVLRPCSRCARPALLRLVGRCADCIADRTFHHPEDYTAFVAAWNNLRKAA